MERQDAAGKARDAEVYKAIEVALKEVLEIENVQKEVLTVMNDLAVGLDEFRSLLTKRGIDISAMTLRELSRLLKLRPGDPVTWTDEEFGIGTGIYEVAAIRWPMFVIKNGSGEKIAVPYTQIS